MPFDPSALASLNLWLDAASGVNAEQCASFAAASHQSLLADHPNTSLQIGSGDFTLAGWFRLASKPAPGDAALLVSKDQGTQTEWWLMLDEGLSYAKIGDLGYSVTHES